MPNDGCSVRLEDKLRLAVIAIKPCGVLGSGVLAGTNQKTGLSQLPSNRSEKQRKVILQGLPSKALACIDQEALITLLLDSFDRPH